MGTSTDRLRLAPDDHSGSVGADKTIETVPLPWLVTRIDAGPVPETVCEDFPARPTLHSDEGADMAKSTRGPNPVDSQTHDSGVNITPLASSGPVTTTHTVA
jgi:hypothetical protein